jgi:hypothetical protein
MNTTATTQYTLSLTEEERNVLLDVLNDLWKTTQIEEHRTDRFHAKEVIQAREQALESLLRKVQAAGPI